MKNRFYMHEFKYHDGECYVTFNICDYAFRRLFGSNTNLLMLCCVGRSKEEIMPEIMQVLEQDTAYKKYLEEYKA